MRNTHSRQSERVIRHTGLLKQTSQQCTKDSRSVAKPKTDCDATHSARRVYCISSLLAMQHGQNSRLQLPAESKNIMQS